MKPPPPHIFHYFRESISKLNFHTHTVEKQKIYSHWKNISLDQLFSKFISKNAVFTEFLPQKCKTKSHVYFQLCDTVKILLPRFYFKNFVKTAQVQLIHCEEITEFFCHSGYHVKSILVILEMQNQPFYHI